MNNKQIKIVVMLYDERSGSTFLASMLSRHPSIGVTIESQFIITLIKNDIPLKNNHDIDRVLEILFSEKKFFDWGLDKTDLKTKLLSILPANVQDVALLILKSYFEKAKPKAKVWLIKQGSYFYINGFKRIFPNVTFIHLIRDGRAVYSSKKKTGFSDSGKRMSTNPILSALKWQKRLMIPENKLMNDQLCEIRYEDYIIDPYGEIQKLLNFIGVRPLDILFEENAKNECSMYFNSIPNSQKNLHKNIVKKPLISRTDAWKKNLTKHEIFIFEIYARKTLLRKGYKLEQINNKVNWIDYYRIYLLHFSSIIDFIKNTLSKYVNMTLFYSRHLNALYRTIRWKIFDNDRYI
jgi:hypothetical protein